jgi:hypothetical protein
MQAGFIIIIQNYINNQNFENGQNGDILFYLKF